MLLFSQLVRVCVREVHQHACAYDSRMILDADAVADNSQPLRPLADETTEGD